MASNYTENYGLCQWEATDQVLRTEFNEGNAKVDEALKELADAAINEASTRAAADRALGERIGLQPIKTVTQSADDTLLEIDLSDVDWSLWKNVYLRLDMLGNGYYYSAYGSVYRNNESHQIPGKHCLVLWPMYEPDSSVGGLFLGYNVPVIIGPCIPYREFTHYRAYAKDDSYTIQKGSKIILFGEH